MTQAEERFEQALVPLRGADLIEEATVGDVLRRTASQSPEALALIEGLPPGQSRREWTYAQLLADSEHAARAMLEHAEPGDKVAIWANNVPEWILVQMGAALAGMTLVTVNPALKPDEAAYVLRNSGAAMVFHVDNYRDLNLTESLDQLVPQLPNLRSSIRLAEWSGFCAQGSDTTPLPLVSPDNIAQIQYTSGTTGLPKGARLRHRGIVNNSRLSFADRVPSLHGARLVHPMPLFHTAGSVIVTLGAIQAQAAQVLMPTFNPGLQLALIESERSTLFGGVSTMLRALLDHPDFGRTDLSSVTVAISGGAMVERPLAREVEARVGVPLVITYGQTECSPTITMTRPEDSPEVRTTTVGRALPGVEMKIVDPADNSKVVAVDETGEMCTRGYHVMIGYHDDSVKTAEAIDSDGWLHTGDLASMDAEGNVQIAGRLKDMIIRGGENIYPTEIETALLGHEAVQEAAVIGLPDDYWGETVAAFVRLSSDAQVTPEALESYLTAQLAKHKVPRRWYFVDDFPLTASGKILKNDLRTRASRIPGQTTTERV